MKLLFSVALFICALPSLAFARTCASWTLSPGEKSLPKEPLAEGFYQVLADYERAFAQQDKAIFRSVLHPALLQKPEEKDALFDDTIAGFGLSKAPLVRNAIYRATFSKGEPNLAMCPNGELRGLVGPMEQIAVFHSFLQGAEQIRLMSIFVPVPKALEGKSKYSVALGMLHVQVWTHERLSPEKLLDDSDKWAALGEPLVGWVLAEGGYRILNANPYFRPLGFERALETTKRLRGKVSLPSSLEKRIKTLVPSWSFVDFTVVYQTSGLEPGLKFRVPNEESIDGQLAKCQMLSKAFATEFSGLKYRFRGLECLPFRADEDLSKAPIGGSQFAIWSDLAK